MYDSGMGKMLGGAKMVGGTNSVYHRDQIFNHRSPRQAPFDLIPGEPIWVTRVQDRPAQLVNLAVPLFDHYFRLYEKATLYLTSGKEGILRPPIRQELYDFIISDKGKSDEEKADLLDRLQDLAGKPQKGKKVKVLEASGGWSTKAGSDRQFVQLMSEILVPHAYDGFVRDIDPGSPRTEIVFFDQSILYECNADGSPLGAGGPAAAGAQPPPPPPPPPPPAASSPSDPGPAAAGASGPATSPGSDPGGSSVAL
jgi:hypothetical protein